MFFDRRIRRVADGLLLGVSALGSAAAVGYAANPAAAAAVLAAASVVTCATTGTTPCVSATNTSSGIGVLGTGNTNAGVSGTSNTNFGIKATSKTNDGVFGQAKAGFPGVEGFTTGSYGVSGVGGAIGVSGYAPGSGFGIYGNANTAGVYALSARGDAVHVRSSKNTGLDVFSESGTAIVATGGGANSAVVALGPRGLTGSAPSDGFPLLLTDDHGTVVFSVDGSGNVVSAGGIRAAAQTIDGATATAFTPQTALPTVEDSGTARLVGGAAVVRLDPVFAASIDTTTGYRVFVTPYGDSHGLFVAATDPGAFTVHESGGGRATLAFDYRIIATARGQTGRRMAVTNAAATRVALPALPKVKLAAPFLAPALPQP